MGEDHDDGAGDDDNGVGDSDDNKGTLPGTSAPLRIEASRSPTAAYAVGRQSVPPAPPRSSRSSEVDQALAEVYESYRKLKLKTPKDETHA